MAESEIMKQILVELPKHGIIASRNNLGTAYAGETIFNGRDVLIKNFRAVKYGVFNPSGSDILGIMPSGKLLAIEVKTPSGRVSEGQQDFINMVNSHGGVAFVARSVQEAVDNIKKHA